MIDQGKKDVFTLKITKDQAQCLEHAILELMDRRDERDAEYFDQLESVLVLLTPIIGV